MGAHLKDAIAIVSTTIISPRILDLPSIADCPSVLSTNWPINTTMSLDPHRKSRRLLENVCWYRGVQKMCIVTSWISHA